MARVRYEGVEVVVNQLEGVGREAAKRIVMAAAEKLVEETKRAISDYHHVDTGSMREAVKAGEYTEFLGGGKVEVYPMGGSAHGIDNAKKAFIIDAGIGQRPNTRRSKGRVKNKTGDHFLTRKTAKQAEAVVEQAMEEEFDKIIAEMNR